MVNGPGWTADHRVGLGHARLSIIDLATGDQPIASEDGRPAYRRQRRVLRLRAHPGRPEPARPSAPDPIGQRDRPAPVRRARHRLPGAAPRRVRLHPLGRPHGPALRGAGPIRDQAAVLRLAGRRPGPRLGGQGAVRGRHPGPMGPRTASSGPSTTMRRRRTARSSRACIRSRRVTT